MWSDTAVKLSINKPTPYDERYKQTPIESRLSKLFPWIIQNIATFNVFNSSELDRIHSYYSKTIEDQLWIIIPKPQMKHWGWKQSLEQTRCGMLWTLPSPSYCPSVIYMNPKKTLDLLEIANAKWVVALQFVNAHEYWHHIIRELFKESWEQPGYVSPEKRRSAWTDSSLVKEEKWNIEKYADFSEQFFEVQWGIDNLTFFRMIKKLSRTRITLQTSKFNVWRINSAKRALELLSDMFAWQYISQGYSGLPRNELRSLVEEISWSLWDDSLLWDSLTLKNYYHWLKSERIEQWVKRGFDNDVINAETIFINLLNDLDIDYKKVKKKKKKLKTYEHPLMMWAVPIPSLQWLKEAWNKLELWESIDISKWELPTE